MVLRRMTGTDRRTDRRTYRRTDGQMQVTTITLRPKRPRVNKCRNNRLVHKMCMYSRKCKDKNGLVYGMCGYSKKCSDNGLVYRRRFKDDRFVHRMWGYSRKCTDKNGLVQGMCGYSSKCKYYSLAHIFLIWTIDINVPVKFGDDIC